jgi:hypothetical protein
VAQIYNKASAHKVIRQSVLDYRTYCQDVAGKR